MSYHNLGPIMVNIGSRLNFTSNAFGTRTSTDSLGRQVTQTVNVDGNRSIGIFTYFSHKIKNLDLDISLNPYFYYTRTINYVNKYLDNNDGFSSGTGIGINKYVLDKYSIQAEIVSGYVTSRSKINPGASMKYRTETGNFNMSLFFLHGTELGTSGDYSWRQKISKLDNNTSIFIWNAYINKNFLKNKLAVRLQINDLLNRNEGITRTINANVITQSNYNVIGRYCLLSLSYRFVHHK
jgi:hypothetical protein